MGKVGWRRCERPRGGRCSGPSAVTHMHTHLRCCVPPAPVLLRPRQPSLSSAFACMAFHCLRWVPSTRTHLCTCTPQAPPCPVVPGLHLTCTAAFYSICSSNTARHGLTGADLPYTVLCRTMPYTRRRWRTACLWRTAACLPSTWRSSAATTTRPRGTRWWRRRRRRWGRGSGRGRGRAKVHNDSAIPHLVLRPLRRLISRQTAAICTEALRACIWGVVLAR